MNVVDIAKELIACRSITPEDDGAIATLAGYLEQIGFENHLLPFEDDNAPKVNNIFSRLGTSGPHIAFAGHTDVVPPGDEITWSVPPFAPEIRDGLLIGRGAVDMKGAIAAFVAATDRYVKTHGKPQGSISFIITGDEEDIAINGTQKMLPWMQANNHIPDGCIVGEPTNPNALGEMIKIGRRGSVTCHMTVKGVQGHVAYPDVALNPSPYLIEILSELTAKELDQGNAHFQPSNLEVTSITIDNNVDNLIPAEAKASCNIRFNTEQSGEALVKWIESVCHEVTEEVGKLSFELTSRISGEAFMTEPGPLSDAMQQAVKKVTGKTPELSTTGGTSDARFIKFYCPVVESGLVNKTAHKVDEAIEVKALEDLEKIYFVFLETFFDHA